MLKRYPLDPTASSETNLVAGEVHRLDTDGHRLVFTQCGAFYHRGLVVKQGSRILTPDKDYTPRFFWQYATEKLGHPVFLALEIINDNLLGEIEITYQVIGGLYQDRFEGLDKLLQTLPNDKRGVYWDEILEKPEAYFPERHLHHINDVFGLSRLVVVIENLRRQLENTTTLKLKSVYDRFLKHRQYVESLLHDVDETVHKVNQLVNGFDGRINDLIPRTEMNAEVARISSTIENNLNARIQSSISETANQIQNLTTQLATLQSETSTNQQTTNSRLAQIEQTIAGAEQQVTVAISNLTKALNDYKVEANGRLTALEEAVNTDKAATETRLSAIESNITEKVSQFDTKLGEAVEKITTAKEEVLTTLTEKENGLKVKLDEAEARLNQKIEEQGSGQSDSVDGKVSVLEGKITQLRQDVEEKETTLNERITSARQASEDKDHEIEQRINDIATLITDTRQGHGTRLTTLESQLATRISELVNEIADTKQLTIDKEAVLNQLINEINVRIGEQKLSITATIEESKESVLATVGEKETALKERDAELTQRISSLETRVNSNGETNSLSVTELRNTLNEFKLEVKSDNQQLVAQINEVKTKNAKQDELIQENKDVHLELKNTTESEIVDIKSRLDLLDGNIDDNGSVINQKIESVKTDLALARDGLQVQINPLKEKVESHDLSLQTLDPRVKKNEDDIAELKSKQNNDHQNITISLEREVERVKNAVKDEINLTINQKHATAMETARNAERVAGNASSSLITLTHTVNQNKTNADEALDQAKNELSSSIAQLSGKVESNRQLHDNLSATVDTIKDSTIPDINRRIDGLITESQSGRNQLSERLTTATESIDEIKGNVTTLTSKVNELELRPAGNGSNIDGDAVRNIARSLVNEAISEARNGSQEAEPLKPEDFIIHPNSEGKVVFGEDGSITVSGIVYMKERHFTGVSSEVDQDLDRHHIFTPAKIHEFDTSTTWVIPDSYDGLLAEVYVTTGIRPAPEQTGGTTAFFTPSTKKMYVLLRGGESVPITVGTISSFGQYVTNDGVNMKGLIHPSFPIVTNLYGANATTDIRTMYGKGGRVVVLV